MIDMDCKRDTLALHEDVYVHYDISKYRDITRLRWNPWQNKPIENSSELCYSMRKVVNSDISRSIAVLELLKKHPRAIIFYNFDYELDILKGLDYGKDVELAEWNGHKHHTDSEGKSWG